MKNYIALLIVLSSLFFGCIKDDVIEDFVEPTLRISTVPDTISIDSTYQFEYKYFNNIGVEENVSAQWKSADPDIIEISDTGLAYAKKIGKTEISIEYSNAETNLYNSIIVNVGLSNVEASNEKSGSIQTTSSYALEGDFILKKTGDNLVLDFFENYKASSALPGLYVYLSNNRNTIANALEISAVATFNGAHSYTIENVGINDFEFLVYFCKPFNVKVGDGEIE